MTLDLEYPRTSRTAIARREMSRPCREAMLGHRPHPACTVLDYGCGKGRDVAELNNRGYYVRGYDPHHGPKAVSGEYHVVLLTYVLNVLPTTVERQDVLRKAWARVKQCGGLYVSVRAEPDVTRAAARGNWRKVGDGWMTKKRTFQHGFTADELATLLINALSGHDGEVSVEIDDQSCLMISIQKTQ